jgi:hypothetical protein
MCECLPQGFQTTFFTYALMAWTLWLVQWAMKVWKFKHLNKVRILNHLHQRPRSQIEPRPLVFGLIFVV